MQAEQTNDSGEEHDQQMDGDDVEEEEAVSFIKQFWGSTSYRRRRRYRYRYRYRRRHRHRIVSYHIVIAIITVIDISFVGVIPSH